MRLTINWDEAPEWANYAAVDSNGLAWYHEKKPSRTLIEFWSIGNFKLIGLQESEDWKDSLTTRPGVDNG